MTNKKAFKRQASLRPKCLLQEKKLLETEIYDEPGFFELLTR